MKTILMIIGLVAVCHLASAQTIRRVNNDASVTGVNVYNTLQAAHDAAVANDIILIEPSLAGYGDLTFTKPLKVYGNGYFLTTNTELRVDQRSSIVGTFNFNTGSGGSYVAGVSSSIINIYGVSNITVTRCLNGDLNIYTNNQTNTVNSNVSGILIERNHLQGGVGGTANSPYTMSNISITNNIIRNVSAPGNLFQSWIVRNNTFWAGISGYTNTLYNSIFENNILIGHPTSTHYILTFVNTTSSYNVSNGNSFAANNGNQSNVDFTTEFVAPAGLSDDEKYQLKNTSVLKTAGSAGLEVGAFGGTSPYVVSGIPPIPSITNMINTGTGSDAVDLQVTISVKANN